MTRQRKVMLEKLSRMRSHPTADELYALVRRTLPRISLATVYRNLEVMAERGLIRKLYISGSQMRFDGNAAPHYHARCLECGRIADLDMDPPPGLCDQAEVSTGFRIHDLCLEFVGLCPECFELTATEIQQRRDQSDQEEDRKGLQ